MMRPLNFAIAGCGSISRTHILALGKIEKACLYAVCDRDLNRAREAGEASRAVVYTDMEELLKDPRVDVVLILTASGTHGDLGIRAARAGKHVVLEKPIDISVPKARELVRVCREQGVSLSCIFQHRYDTDVRALKQAIREGRLGELNAGCCHTKWYRGQVYYDEVDWRGTRALDGGGALMNQGIHQLDLFQYLMGDVEEVSAYCAARAHERIDVEDLCMAVLKFKNGALGLLEASTVANPGFYSRIDVNGSRGTVILQNNTVLEWKLEDGGTYEGTVTELPHRIQLEEIIDSICEGRDSMVSGEEALKALCIIEAVYRSAELGRPVKVAYQQED